MTWIEAEQGLLPAPPCMTEVAGKIGLSLSCALYATRRIGTMPPLIFIKAASLLHVKSASRGNAFFGEISLSCLSNLVTTTN
jgi:hypothetical protein